MNLIDLAALRRPVRDSRRLTSGYHSMYNKIEAIESSRGCIDLIDAPGHQAFIRAMIAAAMTCLDWYARDLEQSAIDRFSRVLGSVLDQISDAPRGHGPGHGCVVRPQTQG